MQGRGTFDSVKYFSLSYHLNVRADHFLLKHWHMSFHTDLIYSETERMFLPNWSRISCGLKELVSLLLRCTPQLCLSDSVCLSQCLIYSMVTELWHRHQEAFVFRLRIFVTKHSKLGRMRLEQKQFVPRGGLFSSCAQWETKISFGKAQWASTSFLTQWENMK